MYSSGSPPASGAGEGGDSTSEPRLQEVPPKLPPSVIEVYSITKSGTTEQRRQQGKHIVDMCEKPAGEPVTLWRAGQRTVFRAAISQERGDSTGEAQPDTDQIAVKTVFNWAMSTSKLETIDSQKEFDVLARLPEHRNLVRVLFECVCEPPLWMVEMMPDPSLVCIDTDGDDADGGEGVPSDGAAPLRPRKAQMVGMELLQRRMCDHLQAMEGDEPGSMPDDVLVQLSSDIADGVHHLLQHGVVHRDLKLDNVMWDSKGGPEGVGRAVLIDLGCSLRVHADGAAVSADPAAATASGADTPQASAVQDALDLVTYRELKYGGAGLGGNQAHLAPEVLDGWNRGAAGDDTAEVPFGKQASWALGVLLYELATGGKHPFGDSYPAELQEGTKTKPGELAAALHACVAPFVNHDVLLKRPGWYIIMVHELLCIDPDDRMDVEEAVRVLRSGGTSKRGTRPDTDVRAMLPALLAGGEECESAVVRIRALVDGLQSKGDWDGVYRVLWQLRVESGIRSTDQLPGVSKQLLNEIRSNVEKHVLCDPGEIQRIAESLGTERETDALIGAFIVWQTSLDSASQSMFVDAGALPGLVSLLSWDKGKEAENAAKAVRNIAAGPDVLKQAIVSAGALPGLVGLLGSTTSDKAENAAQVLRNIAAGPDVLKQAIVSAGALPGLVGLLGSTTSDKAENAAQVLRNIAAGPDVLKLAIVSAGALPGLVGLLGSTTSDKAENAAQVLRNIAAGRDVLKQAIVDAGALPGLVGLLGSATSDKAENAAWALQNIAAGRDVLKQAIVDAGALPGLVGLLGSDADHAARPGPALGVLAHILLGSDGLKTAVVNAGALPGLVGLLRSEREIEAEYAAAAMSRISKGPRELKQTVVGTGALHGLVVLLGSDKGNEAGNAAFAFANIATGSEELVQAVMDAGALPGLVGLLRSDKGRGTEAAAAALRNAASWSDRTKQAVVDAGALPRLVNLLSSSKDDEAMHAAWTLRSIAKGSHGLLKQAIVDAGAVAPLRRLRDFGKPRKSRSRVTSGPLVYAGGIRPRGILRSSAQGPESEKARTALEALGIE